jgi:methyltransferase (TIGR00027 family)
MEAVMRQEKPSFTADLMTAYRTIESKKSADLRICYDPLAQYFLSAEMKAKGIRGFRRKIRRRVFELLGPGWPAYYVARTRYLDDYLQSSLEAGIKQLVILGAGYDSRAYRFEGLKEKTKVFEVDHSATQQVKIAKVKEIFGGVPGHVVFVSIDFDKEPLEQRLLESGYDRYLKTLFIWEGVTPYIKAEAVKGTLAFIAKNSGQGTSIIFDYTIPSVVNGTCNRREAKTWRRGAKNAGEPLQFGIDQETIEDFLGQIGFYQVDNVTGEFLKNAYFTGVNLKREITPIMAIVHATVKPEGAG